MNEERRRDPIIWLILALVVFIAYALMMLMVYLAFDMDHVRTLLTWTGYVILVVIGAVIFWVNNLMGANILQRGAMTIVDAFGETQKQHVAHARTMTEVARGASRAGQLEEKHQNSLRLLEARAVMASARRNARALPPPGEKEETEEEDTLGNWGDEIGINEDGGDEEVYDLD